MVSLAVMKPEIIFDSAVPLSSMERFSSVFWFTLTALNDFYSISKLCLQLS